MTEENTIEYKDSWRNNPTVRKPEDVRKDRDFHKTDELVDGTEIGKSGACWYVIDEDGSTVGKGYHEIRVLETGHLMGRKGAMKYVLDDNGRRISKGYHKIIKIQNGRLVGKVGVIKEKMKLGESISFRRYIEELDVKELEDVKAHIEKVLRTKEAGKKIDRKGRDRKRSEAASSE